MKQTIRFNTFETNSSSTHSLTIMTKDEFEKFKNGELMYERWNGKLIPTTDVTEEKIEDGNGEYWTFSDFGGEYLEVDTNEFTTPSGDKMVAICYFGYDG